MENSEDNLTFGRVTRSRVRRLSVESESTSRPNTPVFVGSKLSTINEPELPSSSRRATRRNSTSGIAQKTPSKTPAKNKPGAIGGSPEDLETPKLKRGRKSRAATPDFSVTPKRSSRARSLPLDEADNVSKLTLNEPLFDVVPEEEDGIEHESPNNQTISKRVTRSQSKSPLDIVSIETPSKPKSKKKMEEVKKDEILEDPKIVNLVDEIEEVEQGTNNTDSLEAKTVDPFNLPEGSDSLEEIKKKDQLQKKEKEKEEITEKDSLEESKGAESLGELKKGGIFVEAQAAGSLGAVNEVESFEKFKGTIIEDSMETNEECNKSDPIESNNKTLEQMDSKCVISICDSDDEVIEIEEDTFEKPIQLSKNSPKQSDANSLEGNTLLQANMKDDDLSQHSTEDIKNHIAPNEIEFNGASITANISNEEKIPMSVETTTNEHKADDLKTVENEVYDSQKETETNIFESSVTNSDQVNDSKIKPSNEINSDGPVISEVIELKSLSPKSLIKVGASPDFSPEVDAVKNISQENFDKTTEPTSASLLEIRDHFDCETPNKNGKPNSSTNSRSVYFDKSLKEDTPKNTYPKTPFSLTKSRSYVDVESSHDNFDSSLKAANKQSIEDKNKIDKKVLILEDKQTPSKSYSGVEYLQSSTPFTTEKYEVYYENIAADDKEEDGLGNSGLQSSPASPDPIEQIASLYNKDTWSFGVSGRVNIDTKLDSLAVDNFVKSKAVNATEDQKHVDINKASKFTGLSKIEYDSVTSEEEELDEDEKPYQNHSYAEYEAMEVDDYHSGDSMNSDEREEIEHNEIPVDYESIGSEDTDEDDLCDDDEDKDSFIVSDDGEEEQLAEFSDPENIEDESLEKSKYKKKYKRIINQDFSDSDETSDSNTEDANEVLLNEESMKDNEVKSSVLKEEKCLEHDSIVINETVDKSTGMQVTLGKEPSSDICNVSKLSESTINLHYVANETDESSNDCIEESALNASRDEILKRLKESDSSNKSKDELSPKRKSKGMQLDIFESKKDIDVRRSILNLLTENAKNYVADIESSPKDEVRRTSLPKSFNEKNKCFEEENVDGQSYDVCHGAELLSDDDERKATLETQSCENFSTSSEESAELEYQIGDEMYNATEGKYIGQNVESESEDEENCDVKEQDEYGDDKGEKRLGYSATKWCDEQDSEKNNYYSLNLKNIKNETQSGLKTKVLEDGTDDSNVDDVTGKMMSEPGVEIKKLDHLRKMFNPLSKTHRQSLNITSTVSNEDMAIYKQIKRLKRQSFGVPNAQDFNPSQSLIETIEAHKKLASPRVPSNKRKRLSKSFNGVGSLDSTIEIDEATRHTNKKSKLTLNESSSDDIDASRTAKEVKTEMLLSSTPHEQKDDPNNNTYDRVIKRCEEIIAINKKNANKILKQIKAKKAPKRLNQKKLSKKKETVATHFDDENNKRPSTAPKLNAKIMTVKKPLKTSPKLLKKVNAESCETRSQNDLDLRLSSKKKAITKVTRVGTFLEEPITPKKAKKLKPLEVLENPTGTISVFPATPKKKVVRGFVEEPTTPKPFSMKRRVQHIMGKGQDTPPDFETKSKRKRRYEDLDKSLVEANSQRKRLNFGKFVEEDLHRTVARRGGTEYLIAKNNDYDLADPGRKQRSKPDVIFNEKALKFKMRTSNKERKHPDEILIRKRKKIAHQQF